MDRIFTNQTFVGRREIVKRKEFAVYPVVLLVEGVHQAINGSPVYYPVETLRRSVPHWEGRPVPVMHPNVGGEYVRANSPHVEADWVVGRIYNARVDNDKLKGEVWVSVGSAEKIAPGLLATLDSGTKMEVSTGVLVQGDNTSGEWMGEAYTETIVYMIPDHLALLPGDKGACSWEDGCGVRVNKDEPSQDIIEAKEGRDLAPVNNKQEGDATMSEKKPCCPEKVSALINNEATAFTEGDREFLSALSEGQVDKLHDSMVAGDDERDALKLELQQLQKKLADKQPRTADEYISQAPPEIAAVLSAGMRELGNKRTKLVTSITANKRNVFTPEQLDSMAVDQLEAIAALASSADYSVRAGSSATSVEEPYQSPATLFSN